MGSMFDSDAGTKAPLYELDDLYSDTTALKIWSTAKELLQNQVREYSASRISSLTKENPPTRFPETVPQTGANAGRYLLRDAEFWTCGFFPGSIYCILERSIKYPQHFLSNNYSGGTAETQPRNAVRDQLLQLSRAWAEPLHSMAHRKDTHDIGFIIEPALRRDYELTGNPRSLQSIILAANNLASRYDPKIKAIRSWDTFVNNHHCFDSKDSGFLVIIDSMCNLDLLYYAAHSTGSRALIDIATTHAHNVIRTHLRLVPGTEKSKWPEYATCHVANLCPTSGDLLQRLTAQGFSDTSTWARGQAWAILGYAQTYQWTKEPVFLKAACGLAQHFISRMETAPQCVEAKTHGGRPVGRYVPLWDFDAPILEEAPLRDSSAGTIAANGMLILSSALTAGGDPESAQRFFHYATTIVKETLLYCYAPDRLALATQAGKDDLVEPVAVREDTAVPPFGALLKNATANFNEGWTDKYSDHGLVYGDYYLLEFGNRLLQAGLY